MSNAHLFQELADKARRVEERGFDSFWLGEHHHSYDGFLPSVIPAAAFLAAATTKITLSSGIFILPLHAPERIAEGCAAFQSMAPGRLRLTIGIGYNADEFAAADIDITKRGKIAEASLTRLVDGDLRERIGSTEIWSGQHSPAGVARAARHGLGLAVPATTIEEFLQRRDEYETQFKPGHCPEPRTAMFYPLWIAEDARQVDWLDNREIEVMRSTYAHNWVDDLSRGLGDFSKLGLEPAVGREARRTQRDQLATIRPAKIPIPTSATHMVDHLGPFIEAGVHELIFTALDCVGSPGVDERALDLLASEVVPQLQKIAQ